MAWRYSKFNPLHALPRLYQEWCTSRRLFRRRSVLILILLRSVSPKTHRWLPLPGICQVKLRDGGPPLYVRKGTTDHYCICDVVTGVEYSIVHQLTPNQIKTVVDLGANIGSATWCFSRICAAERIISVEPDLANFQMLQRNCEHLVQEKRVRLVQAFIASKRGTATIDRSGYEDAYQMVVNADLHNQDTEHIPCVTMPDLLSDQTYETIDLLKCDIEGAEASLFADCQPWIGRVRHLLIEVHGSYDCDALLADLRRNDADFEVLDSQCKGCMSVIALTNRNLPKSQPPSPPQRVMPN